MQSSVAVGSTGVKSSVLRNKVLSFVCVVIDVFVETFIIDDSDEAVEHYANAMSFRWHSGLKK